MLECKRCLIRESGDKDLYESIKRTIESIPAEKRCMQEEYSIRLEACKSCEKLLGGMCRVCGCFVEVRAAKKTESCPLPGDSRWKAEQIKKKEKSP